MPLRKGKSKETVSHNIRTEMHSYDRKGSIGTSRPASRKKAHKQAIAIAMSKAREDGHKKRSSYEDEKENNRYIKKIAAMEQKRQEQQKAAEDNEIVKDQKRAIATAPKVNEKFFTRMKMRGC